MALLEGVKFDVEIEDVDAHETSADAETQAQEGEVAERVHVVDTPSFEGWRFAGADTRDSDY